MRGQLYSTAALRPGKFLPYPLNMMLCGPQPRVEPSVIWSLHRMLRVISEDELIGTVLTALVLLADGYFCVVIVPVLCPKTDDDRSKKRFHYSASRAVGAGVDQ